MNDNLMKSFDVNAINLLSQTSGRRTAMIWNSGFMYYSGFTESKLFARYCSKMERDTLTYLTAVVKNADDKCWNEGLSSVMRSFFISLFSEKDLQMDGLPEDCVDWRFNLVPLTNLFPWNIKDAEEEIMRGWYATFASDKLWNALFDRYFPEACLQFLHCIYIMKRGIEMSNFCIKAVPEDDKERMLFVKLLMNVIWLSSCYDLVWCQQEENRYKIEAEEKQDKIEGLEKDKDYLIELVRKLRAELSDVNSMQDEIVAKRVNDYRNELNEEISKERKLHRDTIEELEDLREKNRLLEESMRIMEEAEEDENEKLPENGLTYESEIVFIVSPATNGRVERTFEKLKQRLPNCKFINSASDITSGSDCYVMLTKYMIHHSLYNSTRDMLLRRGWPYIHSSSQNVDLIISDIFDKTRYNK